MGDLSSMLDAAGDEFRRLLASDHAKRINEPDENETSASEEAPLRRLDSTFWEQFFSEANRVAERGSEIGKHQRLRPPPGHHLLRFADFFYSQASVDKVLKPTIDDLRAEYFEALKKGRKQKALWIRIRGTWAFLSAAGMLQIVKLAKLALRIWRLVS